MSYLTSEKSPFSNFIKKNSPGPSSGVDTDKAVPVPAKNQATANNQSAVSLWPAQSALTLSVYVSASDDPSAAYRDPALPYHTFDPVQYGDWTWPEQSWETSFKVPSVRRIAVLLNGDLSTVSCTERTEQWIPLVGHVSRAR